jgi:hypothetical protein
MHATLGDELSFCQNLTMLLMSTCCRTLRHPSWLPAWHSSHARARHACEGRGARAPAAAAGCRLRAGDAEARWYPGRSSAARAAPSTLSQTMDSKKNIEYRFNSVTVGNPWHTHAPDSRV